MMRVFFGLFIIFFIATGWADSSPSVQMDLFISSTCPHCQKAEVFFASQSSKLPWLHINKYIINQDKADLETFYQRLNVSNATDFGVPAFFFCGSHWVGFDKAENSGKQLMQALQYCHSNRQTPEVIQKVLQLRADASSLQVHLSKQKYSDNQYLLLAFADAFNVCALFFLAGFLATLCREKHLHRQISLGLAFILALAMIHYIQQNSLELYLIILSWLGIPALITGLCMLAYLFGFLKSSKIFIPIVFIFALCLIAYQQSCTSTWTLANAAWLSSQTMLYQLLYLFLYLLPISSLLLIYIFAAKTKRIIIKQRQLKSLGTFVLIGITLFLIVYPWGLANAYLSLLMFPLAILGWYFGGKKYEI